MGATEQRERILAATAELVAKRGYHATTVELIVKRAGLARNTFYEHFANREECLLACLDETALRAGERIAAAVHAEGEWPHQVRAALVACLDYLAVEPARVRTFLVESTSAGPAATQRYDDALERLARALRSGRTLAPSGARLPDVLEDSLVGALVWMVHPRFLRGEVSEIPGLLPRMVRFTLAPYIGAERAAEYAGVEAPAGEDVDSVAADPGAPPDEEPAAVGALEDPVTLRPLPAGRHGMSPELVARDQRKRILAAMVRCVGERGYEKTSIAQVIALASVSRQTYYQHFVDKEDCFAAAYDAAVARIEAHVEAAVASARDWPELVAGAIRALLDFLAAHPDMARLCFTDTAAVGDAFAARRDRDNRRWLEQLAAGRNHHAGARDPGDGIEEALLAGLATLITRRIRAGEIEQLRDLSAELIELALTPFLGPERAHSAALA